MLLYVPWYIIILVSFVFSTIYLNAGFAFHSAILCDAKKYPKTNLFFGFGVVRTTGIENEERDLFYWMILVFWPVMLFTYVIVWGIILLVRFLKLCLLAIFKFVFNGGMLRKQN